MRRVFFRVSTSSHRSARTSDRRRAVEHAEPERDRPPVLRRDREEAVDLGCGPGNGFLVPDRLRNRARESDASGWGAREESLVDSLRERSTQHRATDLHASLRQPPAGGETVDPARHVIAIEGRQRDRAQAALDVRDRPRVLLLGLLGDVGS